MLFHAIMEFCLDLLRSKFWLIGEWSIVGYCGIVLKEKLQKCQSRAVKVITGASYDIRSADVLATLGWQTLDNRRK